MFAHFGSCQPGPGSWGRRMCACARVPSSAGCWFVSKTRNLDEKLKAKCPNPVKHVQKSVSPSKAAAAWKWGCSIRNGRGIKKNPKTQPPKKRRVEVSLLHRVCPVPLRSQGPRAGRLMAERHRPPVPRRAQRWPLGGSCPKATAGLRPRPRIRLRLVLGLGYGEG